MEPTIRYEPRIHRRLINLFFIGISLFMVLPMLLVISISLSSEQSLLTRGYRFIPEEFSLMAYKVLFEAPIVLLRAYGITMIVTVAGTILSLALISLTGYVVARAQFRYRKILIIMIIITMLFNGGLIPFYILITQYLGLKNSLLALILPSLFNPFFVLVMRGFIRGIPEELIDAARLDGASEFLIYRRIIMPLCVPILATFAVLIAFMYWNDWWLALLFIDDPKLAPIQLLLWRMMNRIEYFSANPEVQMMLNLESIQLPTLSLRMAMVVLAAGPMMFVFPFFQRFFVRGLTFGALKN